VRPPGRPTRHKRPYRSIVLWFQGTNLEDPLTAKRLLVPRTARLWPRYPSFGIDPLQTYRQAIIRLSWLSYSRSQTYCDTRGCHSPARPLTRLVAPHAGQRRTPLKSGSAPRVWITPCLSMASPTLITDGSSENIRQSFSASPPFGAIKKKLGL
jgi:hypothetical protein